MSRCDNCNLDYYTCDNCPHREPEKSLAESFAENLEIGWDYAVEQLQCADIYDNGELLEAIEKYWCAYRYIKDNDVDDDKCFEIRQWAINEILKRLED